MYTDTDDIPILGNVRGRIVLIRDFKASSTLGIPGDNNNSNISIQDNNEPTSISNKWDSIKQQLEKASNDHSKRLYINFTSYAVRHALLKVGRRGLLMERWFLILWAILAMNLKLKA